MPVALREYQSSAVVKTRKFFEAGFQSGIGQMATGAGKSVVQNAIVEELFPIEEFRSILIGGLSRDLNQQAVRGFKRQYPKCATKVVIGTSLRPGIGLVMGKHNAVDARIIVGSAQTLMPRFLNKKGTPESELIKPEDVMLKDGGIFLSPTSKRRWLISPRFDEILAYGPIALWQHDEAHHAPADGSMWAIGILTPEAVAKTGLKLRKGEIIQGQLDLIYRYLGLSPLRVVGHTATPIRADMRAMANVFQKIIYTFTDREAEDAGVIRPIHPNVYRVQILTEEKTGTQPEDHILGPEEEDNSVKLTAVSNWPERIVAAYLEHASDRTAVAFVGPIGTVGAIEASKILSRAFNAAGVTSVHIDGTSWVDTDGSQKHNKLRPALFDRIQRGEIRVICNFGVLCEGIDITRLDCVLLARTVNAPMLTQIIGRARRNFVDPVTGVEKVDALLIDFTGQGLVILSGGMLRGIKLDPFAEDQEEKEENEIEDVVLAPEGEDLLDGVDFRDLGLKKGIANSYKISDIVRRSAGQWYTAPDHSMSLAVSEADSLLITMPSFGAADYYLQIMDQEDVQPEVYEVASFLYEVNSQFTLWHTTKGAKGQHFVNGRTFINQNPALDIIEAAAIVYAESRDNYVPSFATKGQSWRSKKVMITADQKNYLHVLLPSMTDCDKLTKGEAAQLITHTLADKAVKQAVSKMQGFIEENQK